MFRWMKVWFVYVGVCSFILLFSDTADVSNITIASTPPHIMQWLLRKLEGKEVEKFPIINNFTDRLIIVIKVWHNYHNDAYFVYTYSVHIDLGRDVTIYQCITILWYIKPVIQYHYKLSCIDMSNISIYRILCMKYPCFDLKTAYYVCVLYYDWWYSCMPVLQFCNYLVGIKHDGFGNKALSICKIN